MIQIDMDKPDTCMVCRFRDAGDFDCLLNPESNRYATYEEQYEHCPLIEVKDGERPNVPESAKDADYPLRLCKRCRLYAD